MISWLLLGFAMGLRHSLEADHVAAVASLSARAARPRDLWRVAGAWGVGHALTLLAVASVWAVAGVSIPDPAQSYVEIAAGLLLIWLGVDLIRQREGGRARVRPHEHSDGILHIHMHWRTQPSCDGIPSHEHPHAANSLRRALIVGAVHGLAGSALIGLSAAGSAHPGRAIAYVGVFAFGATTGMIALSTVISFPLRWPRLRAIASMRSCRVALALSSIAIGIWISVQSIHHATRCLMVQARDTARYSNEPARIDGLSKYRIDSAHSELFVEARSNVHPIEIHRVIAVRKYRSVKAKLLEQHG